MAQPRIPDEIAAAAFWRLVRHLQQWLEEEGHAKGFSLDRNAAREAVYGMRYADWKVRYQTEATSEQLQRMEESVARNPA